MKGREGRKKDRSQALTNLHSPFIKVNAMEGREEPAQKSLVAKIKTPPLLTHT